ncbi:MAG: transposase family protein, partial [Cyanobacteria bacterium MAG IRC1_bin_28]|nr:transposase family protein [Cyanobacteria bacterium MAG IRC1_bin_28]
MPASRFTERQKAQIVEQYRAGSSSVAVGKRFGCSDRTVMRIVRSRLSAAELETRKVQSHRQPARTTTAADTVVVRGGDQSLPVDEPTDNLTGANNLPWEDADDFVENGGADDDLAMEEGDTALPATSRQRSGKAARQSAGVARAADLDVNKLPSPLYLLVERSVELQPQTLGSLHHLVPLDTDEQQRQGLILFSNARQ